MPTGSNPNWVYGYVPTADEWNAWWAKKLDATDTILTGGPFLPLAGGGLTGPLTLSRDPQSGLEASTKQYVDGKVTTGSPSNTNPLQAGTATPGVSNTWTRGDHVHPVDTSRYAATNPSGYQTAAQVTTALAPYALVASPTFTGDPKAPTPAAADNDTSIATTAFVQTAISGVVLATPGVAGNTGRNYLHNSLFNIQQRGLGPWSTSGYTLDRWVLGLSADSATVSVTTLGDVDRTGIGDQEARFALACAYTGSAGPAAYTVVDQAIENVRRLAGKTVVVSFYAVADGARKLGIGFDQIFGSGGSPSATVQGTGQSVILSTTWTRYTLTFAIASANGKTLGTNQNDYTLLNIWYTAGTNSNTRSGTVGVQTGTVNLWGMQVEVGSTATPLERPDAYTDLAKCQRYYQTGTFYNSGYGAAGAGVGVTLPFMVTMRISPTVTPTFATQSNCGSSTASNPTVAGFVPYTIVTATSSYALAGTFTASADY